MFGIGHLFKKMQNRQTREYFVRDIVRQTIKDNIGSSMLTDNIQIKDATISMINISPALKSEIYIKKQRILRIINEKQDIIFVRDIK